MNRGFWRAAALILIVLGWVLIVFPGWGLWRGDLTDGQTILLGAMDQLTGLVLLAVADSSER